MNSTLKVEGREMGRGINLTLKEKGRLRGK